MGAPPIPGEFLDGAAVLIEQQFAKGATDPIEVIKDKVGVAADSCHFSDLEVKSELQESAGNEFMQPELGTIEAQSLQVLPELGSHELLPLLPDSSVEANI
ncbi:hypothetical protein R1flu_019055 [Riccia fluitans]|uniref:Uncharacterized protein n=1 Tax=Riccia fluitans TaxID=41844 RepID=A0ABD1ZHK3_9MARC